MSISASAVLNQFQFNSVKKPSLIRAIFEEGAQLKRKFGNDEVCDFSLGNPTLPPPNGIVDALKELATNPPPDLHSYMPNAGRLQTREAVAKELSKWYGVNIRPEYLTMTCGAASAMNVLFHCIIRPDDEIIVIAPYFLEYDNYIRIPGAKKIIVRTKPDFSLDIEAFSKAIGPNTRGIIMNSPNNPSGAVYSENQIVELSSLLLRIYEERRKAAVDNAEASPIFIISDEPYRRISYVDVPSIMKIYPYTFITTSHSKDLSLPGERIGMICTSPSLYSPELAGSFASALRYLGFVNAPSLMQFVLEKAVDCELSCLEWYKKRKDIFYKGMIEAGLECVEPQGAFYLFPCVPRNADGEKVVDDVEFSNLLKEKLVLCVPGRCFGEPNNVRFAYCCEIQTIEKAIPRIKEIVNKIKTMKK